MNQTLEERLRTQLAALKKVSKAIADLDDETAAKVLHAVAEQRGIHGEHGKAKP